jgi:DNA-binding NtrC family response regulator
VKLLRVLQERQFERLGSEKTITVDVRLVAATNRDLRAEVDAGTFREDLYYRLNVVHIEVPPLRERKEDIPLLMSHFLEQYNERNNRNVSGFSHRAKAAMLSYDWPGNIRELGNCVESAVVLASDNIIDLEDLPAGVRNAGSEERVVIPVGTTMEQAEKALILATIASCRGNKSKAADILGVARKTIHRKVQEYQLEDQ